MKETGKKRKLKIAIVGGGICGFYLAWKLSERGHRVSVFEKEAGPGAKKFCSGLFSERILDFVPESKKLVENQLNFVLIRFPKKSIKVEFSKKFFVMNHSELDKIVFGLAEKAGAEVFFNKNISFLPSNYDKIIGCDGACSSTRKLLELPGPILKLGILGFVSNKNSSDFVETWPHKENGFIWKIPRGDKTEYGIIGKIETAKNIFNNFLKEKNILLDKKEARLIPQGFIIPKNKDITLCGDSAGLTKPWTGGGVVWGLTAANILINTFPDFLKYKKEMKKFFLPEIIFSKAAAKIVYFLGFNIPFLLPTKTKIESDFLKPF